MLISVECKNAEHNNNNFINLNDEDRFVYHMKYEL